MTKFYEAQIAEMMADRHRGGNRGKRNMRTHIRETIAVLRKIKAPTA